MEDGEDVVTLLFQHIVCEILQIRKKDIGMGRTSRWSSSLISGWLSVTEASSLRCNSFIDGIFSRTSIKTCSELNTPLRVNFSKKDEAENDSVIRGRMATSVKKNEPWRKTSRREGSLIDAKIRVDAMLTLLSNQSSIYSRRSKTRGWLIMSKLFEEFKVEQLMCLKEQRIMLDALWRNARISSTDDFSEVNSCNWCHGATTSTSQGR